MTPEQRQFRDRLIDLDREWCRVATLLDMAETKAAQRKGITAWEPETALAYETAVLSYR